MDSEATRVALQQPLATISLLFYFVYSLYNMCCILSINIFYSYIKNRPLEFQWPDVFSFKFVELLSNLFSGSLSSLLNGSSLSSNDRVKSNLEQRVLNQ